MNRMTMKVIIGAVVGLLAPLVFIIGAEPFEVSGRTSYAETYAGSLAVAVYLALCQFGLARKDEPPDGTVKRPVVVAMAVPLTAWVVFIGWVESVGVLFTQALPMLAAGLLGIGTGALLAARRTTNKKAAD